MGAERVVAAVGPRVGQPPPVATSAVERGRALPADHERDGRPGGLRSSGGVGVCRFNDFQKQLGAPPGTIAARLSTFTAEEILARHDDGYVLTEKGRAFFPVLVCALHWAQNVFGDAQGPAVVLTHHRCGRRFVPVLGCDRCGERLRGSHIIPVAG